MTQQNWGSPYPPRPPQYQQKPPQYQIQASQADYEYEDYDDEPPRRKPWQYFVAGGCATLILVGCCALIGIVGWALDTKYGFTTSDGASVETPAVMDDGSSLVAPQPITQPQPVAPQPTQATAPESVGIGQPIIAPATGTELTVFDIQREVQPNNLAPADGMEFVSVAVQLRQTQPAGTTQPFSFDQFLLRDATGELFMPDPNADNGRRLNAGELTADGQPVEGDLLFHIPLGTSPLTLAWQPAGDTQSFSVPLQ